MTKSEAQKLLDTLRHEYADKPSRTLKEQIRRLVWQLDNGAFDDSNDD